VPAVAAAVVPAFTATFTTTFTTTFTAALTAVVFVRRVSGQLVARHQVELRLLLGLGLVSARDQQLVQLGDLGAARLDEWLRIRAAVRHAGQTGAGEHNARRGERQAGHKGTHHGLLSRAAEAVPPRCHW